MDKEKISNLRLPQITDVAGHYLEPPPPLHAPPRPAYNPKRSQRIRNKVNKRRKR